MILLVLPMSGEILFPLCLLFYIMCILQFIIY